MVCLRMYASHWHLWTLNKSLAVFFQLLRKGKCVNMSQDSSVLFHCAKKFSFRGPVPTQGPPQTAKDAAKWLKIISNKTKKKA